MSNNYHIHIFLGLYVNGTEFAIPRGIGVVVPTDPNNLEILYATNCFYYTHTHDSTGVVHVEDPDVSGTAVTGTLYTLGDVFSVWGITVNATQFGQFSGPVSVYTSGQVYRGGGASSLIAESDLTRWIGDPNQIPLYSHEVIWFLVGPTYPAGLPNISFFEEY